MSGRMDRLGALGGLIPQFPLERGISGALGGGASGGGGDGKGSPMPDIYVRPKSWYFSTLPPRIVKPFDYVLGATYNSASPGTERSLGTYTIPDGTSLVLFRYMFFALQQEIGTQYSFIGPPNFLSRIQMKLYIGGTLGETITGFEFGNTVNTGFPFLSDDIAQNNDVPLIVHGKKIVDPRYIVSSGSTPTFPINNIGFHMRGMSVPTEPLQKALELAGAR